MTLREIRDTVDQIVYMVVALVCILGTVCGTLAAVELIFG